MKFAIFESIITPGGHETDFDRILVDELQKSGHEVSFLVPQNFIFKYDYGVFAHYLPGNAVSYTGLSGLQKITASFKREIERQRCYSSVYEQILQKDIDAVIVPTSTYRYLRALRINKLKHSPKPVIFILHGINPREAPKFLAQMEKLKPYPNIKAAVITLSDDIFGAKLPNITCISPPTYLPRDLDNNFDNLKKPQKSPGQVLKLGFFGQYRREKKLDDFLDIFVKGNYTRKIKLLIQGATANPEDEKDFKRITEKYSNFDYIDFSDKWLTGIDWQQQIASIDVLLMPYSAPRYRYHWGGMLFTAIGYQKPVIISDEINPEVTEKYSIGMTYAGGNLDSLQKTIETFINTYDEKSAKYTAELARAHTDYHPALFVKNLVNIGSI